MTTGPGLAGGLSTETVNNIHKEILNPNIEIQNKPKSKTVTDGVFLFWKLGVWIFDIVSNFGFRA
jgi:hypothetical protein